MKMSKRLMAWLLCCAMLFSTVNVAWVEQAAAEQPATGTDATVVESTATPTPEPVVESTATPHP